jgi:hypothetical protein
MSRRALSTLGVVLGLAAAVGFAGCAAASKTDASRPSAAAGAAGDPDAVAEGGDNSPGAAGSGAASSGTSGLDPGAQAGADDGMTCAAELTVAEVVPLDMYLTVDSSASMLSQLSANSTKWSAVKSALRIFLRDKQSSGIGVGLQYFPILKQNIPDVCHTDVDCGDSAPCVVPGICWDDGAFTGTVSTCFSDNDCLFGPCIPESGCMNNNDYVCPTPGVSCGKDPNNVDLGLCVKLMPDGFCASTSVCDVTAYSTTAQAVETLPGAADTLIASLDAHVPDPRSGTPTGPALRGALQQASDWAQSHPDHRVVVVLATDGLPTECAPTNIDEIGDIAFDAVAKTGVKTVVIGMLTAADVSNGAKKQLDTVAHAGGTDKAVVVDTSLDVANQFLDALDAIRTDPLVCQYKVPESVAGKGLDYLHVNVNVKHGKDSEPLFYVRTAADCDPDTGGWYYDSDPLAADPKTIYACPASCETLQATKGASVEIAVGCATVVK